MAHTTNSLVNEIYASAVVGQPEPEVGMGITLLHWTDRSAGTIIRVSPSKKTFWFQSDTAIRTDDNGMSEVQTYRHEPRPDGNIQTARLNKKGQWVSAGTKIRIGERRTYHDYSH